MRRTALALALTLGTALPAAAFDPAAMSDAEKAAFGEAVRAYLMEHPQVLVEAIDVLNQKNADAAAENDKTLVAANQAEIFEDGHSWVGGNPKGDLTVVEFIDYRCGVCRQVWQQVDDLVTTDGNIRIIFKEFPILGEESILASRFAIAVQQTAGPEVYKTVHDRLMAMRGAVTLDTLGALADELKLDRKAILDRMNTEAVTSIIRKNAQLGEKMAIQGTPTFVIGPELLRGVPQAGLGAIVDDIRAKKG